MTALIYKPTFPIPTQGDAGEVLTLNEAGTAYELEPAQGGASGAGKLCWFETVGTKVFPSPVLVWAAIDDGIAPFIDAIVNTDTSKIEIVTTGTYLFRVDIMATTSAAGGATPALTCALNDDSVGPLYDLIDKVNLGAGDVSPQSGGLHIGCPVDLSAGDLVKPNIGGSGVGADGSVNAGVLTLIRIA